ncbi:MarR family winged helix-turn-helix transcriptional regulator [Actinomadura rupiterrae]|uniref:MarR family winged helix-turn-helix transcriptional regulator n=1 Tax=Actinomadura rupiterrae TaxID=559627 RepID=UPI0020A44E0C|nr:MarR family transcriptional regulator [Actinomadura rupiterrae]MCP2336038.1 DNA-binding MarR family transcriptional regulator [Actinomadura rupiterrae]
MAEPTGELPAGLASVLGFQLSKCGWWLEQRLEEELEPLEIRVRHFLVLAMLASSTTLSQQEMASYLLLDPTLMVGLVDDLEARGLCERTRDPGDRRRYAVRITPAGRDVHRRARALADEVGAEIFAPLEPGELRLVADAVGRVMQPFWATQAVRPRRKP